MEFSYQSRKRMVWKLAKLNVNWRTMITLTYPGRWPTDGQEVKEDLNRFLTWYRSHYTSPGGLPAWTGGVCPPYFWFLEFQARNAPHYHLLTSDVNHTDYWRAGIAHQWAMQMGDKFPVLTIAAGKKRFQEMLKVYRVHSHDKAIEAIRERDGALRYAAKYAAKAHQKSVPANYENVGRFWGCSRNAPEFEPEIVSIDEEALRAYLTHIGHESAQWDFLPKHLYNLDKN